MVPGDAPCSAELIHGRLSSGDGRSCRNERRRLSSALRAVSGEKKKEAGGESQRPRALHATSSSRGTLPSYSQPLTPHREAWSVSSCKPGNGVASLRDDSLDTYWQSDGAQPHLVNIQFQKKVQLQLVVLYVDFKLDESYMPSKISIRAGDGFHNLKEIKTVDLLKPVGWVHISLSGTDPRETFIHTFMLQIAVLANHLNGRDTHVRQIKIYGPRP
ncbi:anaphase-promoting complex subunit 10-like [Triticum aestivum]|nr:anaphase-promoting complex subunit 10-like [Triticum aestivum]